MIREDALWDDAGVEGALAAVERLFKGGFQYLNNPLDNLKASQDIVKNSDAVYGYSPNPKSSSVGEYANAIDWTDPIEVEKATLRREAYHSKNDNISEIVAKLKSDGCSKEEMARAANKQRNLNRLNDYINDPEGLVRVKKRNLSSYGNEEGPTADYLFQKYGSWDKVIEKSMGG